MNQVERLKKLRQDILDGKEKEGLRYQSERERMSLTPYGGKRPRPMMVDYSLAAQSG